jgi:hypothetical protein
MITWVRVIFKRVGVRVGTHRDPEEDPVQSLARCQLQCALMCEAEWSPGSAAVQWRHECCANVLVALSQHCANV